jgi:hypothetical protein
MTGLPLDHQTRATGIEGRWRVQIGTDSPFFVDCTSVGEVARRVVESLDKTREHKVRGRYSATTSSTRCLLTDHAGNEWLYEITPGLQLGRLLSTTKAET